MVARSVPFQVNKDAGKYPPNQFLVFGSDAAHSDFATTMARFEFHKSDGSARITESPAIFIRMGGPFQTGLASSYSESSNIFGTPGGITDTTMGSMLKLLKGGADAIYKQIAGGAAGTAGFIGSAGLSGKAQYEFATRTALNTFKQLTYGGPTFRKFSLPFTMRPTSKEEAENMIKIIKTFRVAAAAKGAGSVGVKEQVADAGQLASLEPGSEALAAQVKINEALLSQNDLNAIGITDSQPGVTGDPVTSPNVISFGYPDMCMFQILIKEAGTTDKDISTVFESALCVIENVAIDYGSQNKMVFFDPGSKTKNGVTSTDGIYYPAEVTLTISLTETTLTTAGSVTQDHNQPTLTIF